MRGLSSKLFIFLSLSVLLLVAFLRFNKLGEIPSGLTKDESYYGYDAYSLLHTGKDIWGARLPLFFKSTGEYKLNLTYLIVPAIQVFGLTEKAVRLPSAIFGFGTLIILFLTLKHILNHRLLALTATAIYALSPWSFGMSRLFYEANVGLFFIALGVYATLTKRLGLAASALALSAYLYNPYRYIGLTFLLLAFIYARAKTDKIIKLALVYVAILVPLILVSPAGMTTKRLAQEWLLHKAEYEMTINDMRAHCDLELKSIATTKICYLIWNKPLLHLGNVTAGVVRALSPEFLFSQSANEYILPKQYGMYLSFLLPFYLLGLGWLTGFSKVGASPQLRNYLILTIFTSTAIVSAPGSFELYRYAVPLYLLFLIIAGGGLVFLALLKTQTRAIQLTLFTILLIIGVFQQTKYLLTYRLYSASLPLLFASDAKEIFTYLETKQDYNYIVDKKFHGPLTAAYFWKIDPAYFQSNIVWTDPDPWGFINAYQLGHIHSQTYTIEWLLCEKHKHPEKLIKAVVIDDPGRYKELATFKTYDYSGTLNLHDVYDIDELYPLVKKYYPSDVCQL